MTPTEREGIFRQMKASQREINKLVRQLQSPKLTRQFKNKCCKSAIKQMQARDAIDDQIEEHKADIIEAWDKLPEVRGDGRQAAWDFAVQLCKRKRVPKFMKNQRVLVD